MSTEPEPKRSHILVDLDGTLAHYDGWKGPEHIGEPVPAMLARVKKWLEEGKDVRIFTARIYPLNVPVGVTFPFPDMLPPDAKDAGIAAGHIQAWCEKHLGQVLHITCQKDFQTVEIWDDRAASVILNRGITAETLIAYNLVRVLKELGIKVETGTEYAPAADRAVSEIRRILKAHDDVKGNVEGAADALSYVKFQNADDDQRNLIHAKTAIGRVLKALQ